jgi:hypothetical protein
MLSKLEDLWPTTPSASLTDDPDTQAIKLGVRKVLDITYAHPTIASSRKDPTDANELETFLLRHSDLYFQDILVENACHVTGIIDSDGCCPSRAASATPLFPTFCAAIGDWSTHL